MGIGKDYQGELFITPSELPTGESHFFYEKLRHRQPEGFTLPRLHLPVGLLVFLALLRRQFDFSGPDFQLLIGHVSVSWCVRHRCDAADATVS
jgi:hypothetical protein